MDGTRVDSDDMDLNVMILNESQIDDGFIAS